ncbi:hypothetical protein WA158_007038 [Blastocystis sp. Blastoise]
MVRDCEKESEIDNKFHADHDFIEFYGDNKKMRCAMSIEILKIKYNDSVLYDLYLNEKNHANNGVYVGAKDRNLGLITAYMNGEQISIHAKSSEELKELKEDFEYYKVEFPSHLLTKTDDSSNKNADVRNNMEPSPSNASVMLRKLISLIDDTTLLRILSNGLVDSTQNMVTHSDDLINSNLLPTSVIRHTEGCLNSVDDVVSN